MTATEELRAMLDERGVEWSKPSMDSERWTHWHGCDGTLFVASEDARGCVWIGGSITPAQAVEATLGRGECRVEYTHRYDYDGGYGGTEYEHGLTCGHRVTWGSDDAPDFCPHCGAKVVQQ